MALQLARQKLAAAALLAGTISGGNLMSADAAVLLPSSPSQDDVASCPAGDVKLKQDLPLFRRTEQRNGDTDIDTMSPDGTLRAGACIRETGDFDGGTWIKGEKGTYTKSTNPDKPPVAGGEQPTTIRYRDGDPCQKARYGEIAYESGKDTYVDSGGKDYDHGKYADSYGDYDKYH